MVAMAATDLAESMLSMDEQSFRAIVDDDTRYRIGRRDVDKASPEAQELFRQRAAALRSPAVLMYWYDTLMAMQSSVEGQLAAKAAETRSQLARLELAGKHDEALELEADSEQWRSRSIRFKSGLEQKLIEARRILRSTGDLTVDSRLADERNRALARVISLEDAIRAHRDSFPDDEDPSEADEELWSYVR